MNRRLLRDIFTLALPAILTNITTPVLSMSDMAIAGHYGGATLIAAVALGGAVFNMLYWLFGFLRMGASGLTAQAYGAGDMKECSRVLGRALLLGTGIGLGMILLSVPLCDLILWVMDAGERTAGMAREYFVICIFGAPAVLGQFALTGWLIGMQDSRTPMWVSIMMDLLNIALSVTLVFVSDMGLAGLAIGTLTAQWAGMIAALVACMRKKGFQCPALAELLRRGCLKRFFKVNANIFFRTVCLVAVTMWFTRTGSVQGAVMLAVNALLMQLFTGFSFFMDGFAFAAEALCGRFEGAGQYVRLRVTVRIFMVIGLVLALLFTTIYFLFGAEFLSLLADDAEVTAKASEYMGWILTVPLVSFGAFVWDGVAIGTVHTGAMLKSMIMASGVFLAVYIVTFSYMGNDGLWLSFVSYLFVRGVALSVILRRYWIGSPICSK